MTTKSTKSTATAQTNKAQTPVSAPVSAPVTVSAPISKMSLSADSKKEFEVVVSSGIENDLKASKCFSSLMKEAFASDERTCTALLTEILDMTGAAADKSSVTAKLFSRIKAFYKHVLKVEVKKVKMSDGYHHTVAKTDATPEYNAVRDAVNTRGANGFNIWQTTEEEKTARKEAIAKSKAEKEQAEKEQAEKEEAERSNPVNIRMARILQMVTLANNGDEAGIVADLEKVIEFMKQSQAQAK